MFVRACCGDFGFRKGGIPSSELHRRDLLDIGELFPGLFLFVPLIEIGAASATWAAILTIPRSTKMVAFDISSIVRKCCALVPVRQYKFYKFKLADIFPSQNWFEAIVSMLTISLVKATKSIKDKGD